MSQTNITEKTTEGHPLWLTGLRVILGIILFWKGITFLHDASSLQSSISSTGIGVVGSNAPLIAFLVTYINLLGGFFIALGLFTRTSCIIQIPILLGAIFLVNIKSASTSMTELILSIVVLILLVLFAIKGSSSISADEYFRSYYKAGSEEGNTGKFFR